MTTTIRPFERVILGLMILFLTLPALCGQGFDHFITASGSRLMDGDEEFRFISFNIPTLNYVEDEMGFTTTNPYRLPDAFEMRDAFATIRDMGGRVIRIYTIPVRNRNFPPEAPTYVEGPGQFNEEAFRVTDLMLSLANEYGVRIIFSLLNNWQWMGGRPNYAAFREKSQDEFWTDPQLMEDFKQTVRFVVNRINTISGVPYKEDKAILCWETGNELQSPFQWTRTITRYIKSLDPNHLVMDGYYAIDDRTVPEEALLEPSIDMVSSHHYENNPLDIPKHIRKNLEVVKGRKPYLVGEFGFVSTTGIEMVLDSVIASPGVCGALIWGMRYHRREGGFYWHSEPLGNGIYKSYHWPGFPSGITYDETALLGLMRAKAFEIQGKKIPGLRIPEPPRLLPVEDPWSISWQGSTGARGYHVERSISPEGPWETVGSDVSDADVPYFPLFHDQSARIGNTYYYRVRAMNEAGISAASNVEGPVEITRQALIDRMKNYGTLFHSRGVAPVTGNDRDYKEIINRIRGDAGAEMIYKVPGEPVRFTVYAFEQDDSPVLFMEGSPDGRSWQSLEVQVRSHMNAESNYNYLKPKTYTSAAGFSTPFIRIRFRGPADLARVEIQYH